MKDLERGGAKGILPDVWQTDDSMDPNSWGWASPAILKNSTELLSELADITSKNGNLLLNVPPLASGDFDKRVVATLEEIGDWLALNGVAIYKTKPWTHCCEDGGNISLSSTSRTELGRWPIYQPGEYRFTTSDTAIFAIAFGWPAGGRAVIASLNSTADLRVGKKISAVSIIGAPSLKPIWKITPSGMELSGLPATKPQALAKFHSWVLRMHLDGATAEAIDASTLDWRQRIHLKTDDTAGIVALASSTGAAVMDGVQLLYNNDGGNLWAVDSSSAATPYHPHTGFAIDTATIRGSAKDVANIADVDLICMCTDAHLCRFLAVFAVNY